MTRPAPADPPTSTSSATRSSARGVLAAARGPGRSDSDAGDRGGADAARGGRPRLAAGGVSRDDDQRQRQDAVDRLGAREPGHEARWPARARRRASGYRRRHASATSRRAPRAATRRRVEHECPRRGRTRRARARARRPRAAVSAACHAAHGIRRGRRLGVNFPRVPDTTAAYPVGRRAPTTRAAGRAVRSPERPRPRGLRCRPNASARSPSPPSPAAPCWIVFAVLGVADRERVRAGQRRSCWTTPATTSAHALFACCLGLTVAGLLALHLHQRGADGRLGRHRRAVADAPARRRSAS